MKFKLLLLLLLFTFFANAQRANDSLSRPTKHPFVQKDNDQKYSPDDMRFIPSDFLYDHNWDNTNVSAHRVDLSNKKDTTFIVFNKTDSGFHFPYKGKLISPFGFRGRQLHTGLDIKLNAKDTVVCAFDGVVRMAKKYGGYGNVVVVRHYNGLETLYGHLSKINVVVNQKVKAGELIGLGGRTGRATTNHLHFESRFLGEAFNPLSFLDLETFKLKTDTLLLTSLNFRNYYRSVNALKNKSKNLKTKKGKTSKTVTAKNTDTTKTKAKSKKTKSSGYTIKSGDNLSSIAKNNHTSVEKICKLNNISKDKALKVGTNLKVK